MKTLISKGTEMSDCEFLPSPSKRSRANITDAVSLLLFGSVDVIVIREEEEENFDPAGEEFHASLAGRVWRTISG